MSPHDSLDVTFQDGEDQEYYHLEWIHFTDERQLYLGERHIHLRKGCWPGACDAPRHKVHRLYQKDPPEGEHPQDHCYLGQHADLEFRGELWITSRATALCLQYGPASLVRETPEGWVAEHVGSKATQGIWAAEFVRTPFAVKLAQEAKGGL